MDPLTSPEQAVHSPKRGHGAAIAVAALILAMVALSIIGSALWRPEPLERVTLELGNATPVRLAPSSADKAIAGVLQSVAPTVAFITLPDLGRSGSGVVVHEAGFVVTNAHVVDGSENIRVAFDDGEEYDAELYGIDVSTDLAVLKLRTDRPVPVAALGDSDALRVGEFVLALGAPFGLEATATSGIVSGLHRSGLGIARFEDFIVTDAPINRGNSGGPLVNLRGEVVGINTAIIAGDEDTPNVGTFAGVGFAIPVNVMRVVAQRLIGDGGLALPGAEPADEAGNVSDAGSDGFAARTIAYSPPAAGMTGGLDPERRSSAASLLAQRHAVGRIRATDDAGHTVGRGTGFVIEAEGNTYLLTNQHVVQGAAAVAVYFPSMPHGVPGKVLVANARLDLALVQLPDSVPAVALPLGDANAVMVGDEVVAGAARVTDAGIDVLHLSGRVTEVPAEVPRVAPDAVKIATDIGNEVGDSGGPLLDADGGVVAVMVARERDDSGAQVSGRRSYAILLRYEPEIRRLIDDMASRPFDPGMTPIWPREDNAFILATALISGGAADELGIRQFDRIVSIGGQPVPPDEEAQKEMYNAFVRLEPGTEIEMGLERRGEDGEFRPFAVTWVVPERPPVP